MSVRAIRLLRAHRLAACKSLGWIEIPVVVADLSTLDAELAEIDENLIRNDLSVLEHAPSAQAAASSTASTIPTTTS